MPTFAVVPALRQTLFTCALLWFLLFGSAELSASTNPDAIFFNQAGPYVEILRATHDVELPSINGYGRSLEISRNTARQGLGWIYWPDGRYMDRSDPFFYEPSNYRGGYWALSADYSAVSNRFEIPDVQEGLGNENYPRSADGEVFAVRLGAKAYSDRFYLSGSTEHYDLIRPGDSNPRSQVFAVGCGVHNSWIETGLDFQSRRTTDLAISTDLLATASARITFAGGFSAHLAASQYFQGRDLDDRTGDSAEFLYVNSRYWWQAGAGGDHTWVGDYSTWTKSFHVGKYLKNFLIKLAYSTEKGEYYFRNDLKNSAVHLEARVRVDKVTIVEGAISRFNTAIGTTGAEDSLGYNRYDVLPFGSGADGWRLTLKASQLF